MEEGIEDGGRDRERGRGEEGGGEGRGGGTEAGGSTGGWEECERDGYPGTEGAEVLRGWGLARPTLATALGVSMRGPQSPWGWEIGIGDGVPSFSQEPKGQTRERGETWEDTDPQQAGRLLGPESLAPTPSCLCHSQTV